MSPKEHNASPAAAPKPGFLASLCAALRVAGSSAPSSGRIRLALLTVFALSALTLTAAPALAAAPEPPEALKPEPIKPTEATLQGIVNPKISAAAEPGTYQFEYKATKTATKAECESAGASKRPASPGMYFGLAPEPESEPVTGLTEGTEYIVCLAATTAGGTTVGPPFPFKTGLKLEIPVNAKVKVGSITGTTAEVEGELNPGKERKVDQGSFEIIYKVSSLSAAPTGECEESRAPEPAATASGALKEAVGPLKLEHLQPNAKYTFCLRVHNEDGEEATGAPVSFTTKAAPPAIVSESTSNVKATEATLEGVVNPNNQVTECHFQYGLASGAVSEHEVPCSPELVKGFGEQSVTPMKLNEKGESVPAPITGLEPGHPYRYRIVATNGKGEVAMGVEKEFKRVATPPEAPKTEAANGITNTTVVLHGLVNPTLPSIVSWYFEYNEGASCGGGDTTPATAFEEVQAREEAVPVTALEPGKQYTYCLVAENEAKERTPGNGVSFTTTAVAPVVGEVAFSNVGSGSAKLTAQIDPEGSDTTYRFEYGTSVAYGQNLPSPDGHVGASSSPSSVQVSPQGLTPGTVYHFRTVALSANGETTSADASFSTLPEGILGLPDGRVFEMVSPVNNYDANIYVPSAGNADGGGHADQNGIFTMIPFQAASDGNAVAYVADPTVGGDGIAGQGGGNQYLATRSPGGGWTQFNITPPQKTKFYSPLVEAFSGDLSTWVTDSEQPLSEGAPRAAYHDLYTQTMAGGTYHPLFTGNPPTRGPEEFGTAGVPTSQITGERDVLYAGGSSDLSHLLFEANDVLSEDAPAVGAEENNLYDSVDGQPHLVNVLPNGTAAPNATFGARALAEPNHDFPDFSHVISKDGSRVFWTDLNTGQLFVREDDGGPGARTVQIDASKGPGSSGGGRFWTASSDGSTVFFTDENQLTNDSTAAPGAPDLYRYEVASGGLTDITVDPHGGEHTNVQGVLGASEDGAYVYFVAGGVLAQGATPQECSNSEQANSSGCNLYVLHEGEPPTFIATLSAWLDGANIPPFSEGTNNGNFGDWQAGMGKRTAEVAADGRSIAFMSTRSLTGYPNRALGGPPLSEVYVYEVGEAGDPHLFCVSCSRSGEPPTGTFGGTTAFFPVSFNATYQPRVISADGSRVFFDSLVPLVAQDTNGQRDVYEWERQGSGSCGESSGCVYLLSGGTSTAASALVDASESGGDVFIITRAQLVGADQNGVDDLYDARVDGAQPLAPPACSGTGCQGVPGAPPIFATPSSVTFSGVGNFPPSTGITVKRKARPLTRAQKLGKALKVCKSRQSKRKRAACEAQVRKRYRVKAGKSVKGRK